MENEIKFLDKLFSSNGVSGPGFEVNLRLLRRAGRPFLLLPPDRREAVATLSLYAPQTARAQIVRAVLRWIIELGLGWPGESVHFQTSLDSPFVRFLASLSAAGTEPPHFGILAGNPATPGQRFLLLCFNATRQPAAVVKISLTARGHELIDHEQSLLRAVTGKFKGVPSVLETFESRDIKAFASPFYPGNSPETFYREQLPLLLNSWVDTQRVVKVSEMPSWLRLERCCSNNAAFQNLSRTVAHQEVHPCLEHGDFVPWNIRISAEGNWTVVDWERGELTGIPGWDWFHYTIQTAILVKRRPIAAIARQIEGLLAQDSFKAYANRCGIVGFTRELLLLYLINMIEVIKPSEGCRRTNELFSILRKQWGLGD